MRFIKSFILLLFIALVLIFFMQNEDQLSSPLTLKFKLFLDSLNWEFSNISTAAALLCFAVLGFLVATFIFFMDCFRRSRRLKAALKANRELEMELSALRNLPLDDVKETEGTNVQGI